MLALPVSSVESVVTTPLTTDDIGSIVTSSLEDKSKKTGQYTISNLATSVAYSPNSGRPKMAASLPKLFAQNNDVAQLKEVGAQAGLQGKDLADFIASRLSKKEELEVQLKVEEDERLVKERRAKEEMELRRWELEIREREVKRQEQADRDRAEAEEARWERMFQVMQGQRQADSTSRSPAADGYKIRLPSWEEKSDIDQFLSHFEKVATLHGWRRECWGIRLVPLLTGTAREAYLQMEADEEQDYDHIKSVLRRRFSRDANFYRKKFREIRREPKETYPQFLLRLKTNLERWAESMEKNLKDVDEVKDMFLQEQLLSTITGEMETRIREEETESVEEMAELAQRLYEARVATKKTKPPQSIQQSENHSQASETKKKEGCQNCGRTNHETRDCFKAKRERVGVVRTPTSTNQVRIEGTKMVDIKGIGKVNGREATFLRDTGAGMCMVSAKLVDARDILEEKIIIQLANRQEITVPLAEVDVETPYIVGRIRAAVFPELIEDLIVGNKMKTARGNTELIPVIPPTDPRIEDDEEKLKREAGDSARQAGSREGKILDKILLASARYEDDQQTSEGVEAEHQKKHSDQRASHKSFAEEEINAPVVVAEIGEPEEGRHKTKKSTPGWPNKTENPVKITQRCQVGGRGHEGTQKKYRGVAHTRWRNEGQRSFQSQESCSADRAGGIVTTGIGT